MPPYAGTIPAKGRSAGQQILPVLLASVFKGMKEKKQQDYDRQIMLDILSGKSPEEALRRPQSGGLLGGIFGGGASMKNMSPFTQAFLGRYVREPQSFTLGGGTAPEERYTYDPITKKAEKIATGPTPPVKAQAGRGMVFQNDAGEYRYGIVNPYTGDVVKDLRHASEQDLQEARIEGTLATTEKTRAGTEKIYDDMVLNQLKEERAQTKDEAAIRNLDSMISNRESMLGIRQKESEANIGLKGAQTGLAEARTEQTKKGKPDYGLMRMRQSHLQQAQKLLFAELHDVLNPPAPERVAEIQKEMAGINEELNRLPEIQSQQSATSASSETKITTPPADRQSFLMEYKRLGNGKTPESRDFADKYLLPAKPIQQSIVEPKEVRANLESNVGTEFKTTKTKKKFVPRSDYEQMAAKYGLTVSQSEVVPGVKQKVPEIGGIPYWKLWMGIATEADFEQAAELEQRDRSREITDPLNRRMSWQPVR
ncbi:MAG: hypothetical protein MUO27_08260 [Sedimentisphaerales bacterium]|nr:hypothetical protein [Sedimentisphaerales bacterium]